jgi:hypothetical protein
VPAPLPTEDDVKDILPDDADTAVLDPYITAADIVVTALCVPADPLAAPLYPDATLLEIKRWVAAHLYAINPQMPGAGGTVRERVDVAEVWYNTVTGNGLDTTVYGRTAKLIDTGGYLSKNENWRAKVTRRQFTMILGKRTHRWRW